MASAGNLVRILGKVLEQLEIMNANFEQLNKQAHALKEEDNCDENRKSYNNGYQNGPKLK